MSRTVLNTAVFAALAAFVATPTLAASWHHHGATRYQPSWQTENTGDPTQYMVENSIPVRDHHTPGIPPSTARRSGAGSAYAYVPTTAYRQPSAFATDPTMYAIRNSIPETYPHVPGFGARP